MITFQDHLGRCRRDRNLLYATLGVTFWTLLAVAALAVGAVSALVSP